MKQKTIHYLSILFIGVGSISLIWSLYSYSIGFFASKKQTIHVEEFTPSKNVFHHKKDIPLYKKAPEVGDDIGTLTIPELNMTIPIFHGTNDKVLKQGVGHYAKSALPGEKNNMVLSGHRDTVFRRLGELGEHDKLIVSNHVGHFLYKIKKVRIVDRDDRTVIVPKPRATLTVTTCYPFNYIGNAKQRFVLEAVLIDSKLNKITNALATN